MKFSFLFHSLFLPLFLFLLLFKDLPFFISCCFLFPSCPLFFSLLISPSFYIFLTACPLTFSFFLSLFILPSPSFPKSTFSDLNVFPGLSVISLFCPSAVEHPSGKYLEVNTEKTFIIENELYLGEKCSYGPFAVIHNF